MILKISEELRVTLNLSLKQKTKQKKDIYRTESFNICSLGKAGNFSRTFPMTDAILDNVLADL